MTSDQVLHCLLFLGLDCVFLEDIKPRISLCEPEASSPARCVSPPVTQLEKELPITKEYAIER
jgi:hypothetical protein